MLEDVDLNSWRAISTNACPAPYFTVIVKRRQSIESSRLEIGTRGDRKRQT